jgi:hypothetical protein
MWRMRTLWLPGFMTMTLGAVGCVIEGADDSAFDVTWDLSYVDDGGRVNCEDAGTPWVSLQARHLNTNSVYSGDFPCASLRGISQVLPHGQYEATLSLLDEQKRPVSQITGGPFSVHRHGLTALPMIEFQIQTWELEWLIVRRVGDRTRPATCGEAGVRTIELETQLGTEGREKYTFPCDDLGGITQAIRTGTYAYQVRLLDAAGNMLTETPVKSYRVSDQAQAFLTETFEIE